MMTAECSILFKVMLMLATLTDNTKAPSRNHCPSLGLLCPQTADCSPVVVVIAGQEDQSPCLDRHCRPEAPVEPLRRQDHSASIGHEMCREREVKKENERIDVMFLNSLKADVGE